MTGSPLSLLRSSAANFANTNRTAGTMRSIAASLVKTASGFEAYSAGNVGIAFGSIGCRPFTECAVDRRTSNAKRLGNGRRSDALLLERLDPRNVNGSFAPLVNAGRLCFRDTFHLAFLAQIGFKFRKYAQHVEESFAGCGAGVYRLLSGLQAGTLSLYRANDILKIANAPGQAIDSGDHQNVTGIKKIQHRLKLGAAGCSGSAALFGANDTAPRHLQRGHL